MGQLYNEDWEHVDIEAIIEGIKGNAVVTGLEVTESSTPAMTIQVSAGSCVVDDIYYKESSNQNLNISNGDSTYDRKDIIIYDTTASNPAVIEGTPAVAPVPKDITNGDILLGIVYVEANEIASIINADITNDRVFKPDGKNQSFTNLLENGDFESWSAGAAAVPDGWSLWNLTVARDTIHKISNYSAKVTPSASSGSLYIEIDDYERYKSKVVSFACWVKSDGASQARLRIYDGVDTSYSTHHTGGNTWELLTVTHTLNASATKLEINCTPDTSGGNDFGYFDGAILVEGSICPPFSGKPLIDDGQSIVIDSTTNQVTIDGTIMNNIPADATKYPDTGEQAFLDADHTKLDAIAANATKYPDTGEQAFLDADHTKLDAIAANADETASNPPQAHESSHNIGGSDEISDLIVEVSPSDTLLHTNAAEKSASGTPYTKIKQTRIGAISGDIRVTFECKVSTSTGQFRIYVNGSHKTSDSTSSTTYVTKTQDISNVHVHDLVQIYVEGTSLTAYAKNLKIKGTKSTLTYTSQDP